MQATNSSFLRQYSESRVDGTNSLWFSCCLVEPDTEIIAEVLRTTFSTMPDLRYLLVFVPSAVSEEDATLLSSSERTNGQRAKTTRKIMRERVPPLQNSKNPYAKLAAKLLSDDNTKKL